MAEKLEQYIGTGRRKTATARVYLRPGKGKMIVNGKDWKSYFGDRPALDTSMRAPLTVTENASKFDIIVNVIGGGPNGQATAIRHGIARALLRVNPANRFALKKAGFLTRDPRAVERKKPGLHKARKRSQYSKR
jgi:small subunit ribosomal protein S9